MINTFVKLGKSRVGLMKTVTLEKGKISLREQKTEVKNTYQDWKQKYDGLRSIHHVNGCI